MSENFRIGIIGCGDISDIYLEAGKKFDVLEIVACAARQLEHAQAKAKAHGIAIACSPAELLANPDIDIVVNLTVPQAHFEINLAAIEAGKSVYSEKPLAINREQGAHLLEAASANGVRIGCAPDTFLGGGLQTCRKLIDEGWIGRPVAATAFILYPGHESWHPNPAFFYQPGAGPMFDMGPYYLTALVSMLGPVQRVTGSAQVTFPTRTITSQPKYGQLIEVNVPTYVVGVLDFVSGVVGTIITSFDVWSTRLPYLEIYGTQGSLSLPDPNTFGGPVYLRRADATEWSEIPLIHGYTANSRGLGVADLAYALRSGRPHRASSEMAYHVLDIMEAIHEASKINSHIILTSSCERPAPLPLGLHPGVLA